MAKGLGLSWEQEVKIELAETARQAELRTRKEVLRALLEKKGSPPSPRRSR